MNVLFLGGNSPRHEAWIHAMADQLNSPFDKTIVHDYKHWKTGDRNADIDYEITEIHNKITGLEPYVVFAKSIGTVITLKAIHEGAISPRACVFLGLPLTAITDMNLPIATWLAAIQMPLYFLHNEHDPYGSAEELKAMLPSNIDQSNIIVMPGDTHDYNDVKIMSELLTRASM